jgi:hypothetical protein
MGVKLSSNKKQKMHDVHLNAAVDEETISIQDNIEEKPILILKKLMNEEYNLIEEKEKLHTNLASLRKKRRLKIQRKIRRKKKSIHRLRAEIKDLKFSCEELSKSFREALT